MKKTKNLYEEASGSRKEKDLMEIERMKEENQLKALELKSSLAADFRAD